MVIYLKNSVTLVEDIMCPSPEESIRPEILSLFLEKRDITPGELAKTLGVSEVTVQRWLTGKSTPTGTSAAVLTVLISLAQIWTPPDGLMALLSGYMLYQRLKSAFETEAPKELITALDKAIEVEHKKQELEKARKEYELSVKRQSDELQKEADDARRSADQIAKRLDDALS
jgi:DNA-binding transcriptional regulator YiaG